LPRTMPSKVKLYAGDLKADGLDTLTYNWLMTTGNRVDTRKLGVTGLEVFPMVLGCMGMSGMYQ
jgi:hypothetical protein